MSESMNNEGESVSMVDLISCSKCSYETESESSMEAHTAQHRVLVFDGKDHSISSTNAASLDCEQSPFIVNSEIESLSQTDDNFTATMRTHSPSPRPVTFECTICASVHISELDLEWHVETEHVTSSSTFWSDTCQPEKESINIEAVEEICNETFSCMKCEMVLESYIKLNEHLRIHAMYCELCSYTTLEPSELTEHKQNHHPSHASLRCDQCEYLAESNETMQIHINKYHDAIYLIKELLAKQTESEKVLSELKSDFRTAMQKVTDDLNILKQENVTVKQELFILRQIQGSSVPRTPVPVPNTNKSKIFPHLELDAISDCPENNAHDDLDTSEKPRICVQSLSVLK